MYLYPIFLKGFEKGEEGKKERQKREGRKKEGRRQGGGGARKKPKWMKEIMLKNYREK